MLPMIVITLEIFWGFPGELPIESLRHQPLFSAQTDGSNQIKSFSLVYGAVKTTMYVVIIGPRGHSYHYSINKIK